MTTFDKIIEQRGDPFSVRAYPMFADAYDARDVVVEDGQRYVVMIRPTAHSMHTVEGYEQPQYLEASTVEGLDRVAVLIPNDCIFLGSILLDNAQVASDRAQYYHRITELLKEFIAANLQVINAWKQMNSGELPPMAFSPSTGKLYGLIA